MIFRSMLKSKIHRAVVTETDLEYEGSITIDSTLLDAAGMLPGEKVHVVNINNGMRLETYIIPGEPDSGIICMNGAAARCAQPGDRVIVISYCLLPDDEARSHEPIVVKVDEKNRIM